VIGFVIAAVAAFLAGTAAHESVHYLTARALDADVRAVRWLPPQPQVAYVAPSERADAAIRGVTVPAALVVLVGVLGLVGRVSLRATLLAMVVGVAFLPRSRSDWRGLAEYVKCVAMR
jgi:hypothetical protein